MRLGAGKNFLNSFLISGLSLFAAYLPPQYVSATRSSLDLCVWDTLFNPYQLRNPSKVPSSGNSS